MKAKKEKPVKLEMPFDEAMARFIQTPPPQKKERKKHTPRKNFKKQKNKD